MYRKIHVDCPVLEWMAPHVAQTVNRFQVVEDGRTAHYRQHLKHCWRKNVRIRRGRELSTQTRQRTLDAKFREAILVGYSDRTAGHVVILPAGCPL